MPTDNRTSELVINKLSKQQYESIQNPDPNQLYLVPEDEEHKPICYPTTASEVKTTSMLVKSSVSDNGKILTENGFVYNTSGNPTISDTKVICDLGVGHFEKKLENLTTNTEYHIKSYGQNSSGIVYGSELVQMTLPSPIPVEYQLVEYLESTGGQYINTGMNYTTTLELTAKGLSITLGAHSGTSSSVNGVSLFMNGVSKVSGYYSFYLNSWIPIPDGSTDTVVVKIAYPSITVFNEDLTSRISSNQTNTISRNIYLFASNGNGGVFYGSAKIYNVRIKNNDIIERNLYSVYRIADNKPGMYDIVNNVFYTNQGTGEFIVGPDKEWDEN